MTVFNQSCGGTLGLSGGVTKQPRKNVGGLLGLFGGLHSGTAQAGASKSVTLAAAASALPDVYAGCTVEITGGTGAGQVRNVVGSRKNLLAYSQAFDNAYWARTNCTIVANATASPDGTMTADKVVSNLITGRISVRRNVSPINPNIKHAASRYFKAAEWSRVCFFINQATVSEWPYYGANVVLDLIAGTSSHPSIVSIVPVGNGWHRATIAGTPTTNNFYSDAVPLNDGNNNINAIVGDGVSGIYMWGGQLEEGNAASEYIHTEANPAVGAIIDTPWDIIPDATSTYILRDGKNTRLIGKAVGGVLAFVGGVTRLTARVVGGSLSFAGSLSRQIGKQIGGALSFSGGVSRQTSKLVGGVLSFSGGLGRVFSNTIVRITMLFKKRGMTFTFSQRTATFTASKRSATFRKVP